MNPTTKAGARIARDLPHNRVDVKPEHAECQCRSKQAPHCAQLGACGVFTKENTVVRTYSKGYVLRCGGPRLSSNPNWGYRHIIKKHREDFGRLTPQLLTNRNWRDLTDFVIEWTIVDPDHTRAAGGGQTCRDRVFWLADANGRTVLKQRFKLYTKGTQINTVFPSTTGCS